MKKIEIKEKKTEKYEKEFLEELMKKIVLLKEEKKKKEVEKVKEEAREVEKKALEKKEKERSKVAIAKIEKKLKPEIMEKEKVREHLAKISLEKEKDTVKTIEPEKKELLLVPKPTPSIMAPPEFKSLPAPRYRSLPPPPKKVLITPAPSPMLQIPPAPQKPKTTPLATAIDLGKLNSFLQDEAITAIQCDGANIPIKIIREGKVTETVIVLSEQEIKEIIKKFADRTGQAVTEPVFKTQIGNLVLTAVISSFAGSRFVISKI